MGGLDDAGSWGDIGGLAWALFAAAAGIGLAVVAATLMRRAPDSEPDYERGYNALAPVLDRRRA